MDYDDHRDFYLNKKEISGHINVAQYYERDDDLEYKDGYYSNYHDIKYERELCKFYMKGHCKYGEHCYYAHADKCNRCFKYVYHPDIPMEVHKKHNDNCNPAYSTQNSQDVECGICMEKVVLTKCRRFGLLSCEHPFCLSCIREWRTTTVLSDQLVRTCPICRTTSYFIVPSYYWVTNKEEKDRVIERYKSNLGKIPCKHYDEGRGACPFGTSCFYSHQNADGSYENIEVRKVYGAGEECAIINDNLLSDFFDRAFA